MKAFFNKHPQASRLTQTVSIIFVLLLALSIRFHHLDFESLWMDEIHQTSYYSHSFAQLINDAAFQMQPPLDYWIGHLTYFFSYSDFAVRTPAALFGVASVFLLIRIVAILSSWWVGIGTGFIAAILPFNIYYSQEARPYSIAIFFFLGSLWSIDRFINSTNRQILRGALLLFFLTGFLYSRALSPLVVTGVLFIYLLIWLSISLSETGLTFETRQKKIMAACLICVVALALYFPCFNTILSRGGRYLSQNASGLGIDFFLAGLKKFHFMPIWKAFVVQSEPLTYIFLALILLLPIVLMSSVRIDKNFLLPLSVALLVGAGILNIFIFNAKSPLPFRPPYAIYLLPLTMILSAASYHWLWQTAEKLKIRQTVRIALVGIALICIINAVGSVHAFKKFERKADWKNLTGYLSHTYGTHHVLIFDSLSPFGQWEPTFYGFPRYYRGSSALVSIHKLPFLSADLKDMAAEPVFILFRWRDYYLTPSSKYPIMTGKQNISYERLESDQFLNLTPFTGFFVVTLSAPSRNFIKDSYALISRIISDLPRDSSLAELHLAGASLSQILDNGLFENHLKEALVLAGEQNKTIAERLVKNIRQLSKK